MMVTGQIEKLHKEEAAIKAEEGEMMDLLVRYFIAFSSNSLISYQS